MHGLNFFTRQQPFFQIETVLQKKKKKEDEGEGEEYIEIKNTMEKEDPKKDEERIEIKKEEKEKARKERTIKEIKNKKIRRRKKSISRPMRNWKRKLSWERLMWRRGRWLGDRKRQQYSDAKIMLKSKSNERGVCEEGKWKRAWEGGMVVKKSGESWTHSGY